MEFSEVIKNRYSCKKFSDKEVEKEKLSYKNAEKLGLYL